jgi:CRISPR-associated protein Cas2
MKANYLVCYDICDPGRLSRLYRFIRKLGIHTQYSVFYCRLTWEELAKLKARAEDIIDAKVDDVRIYPLPSDLKVTVMGCGDRMPKGVDIFLQ